MKKITISELVKIDLQNKVICFPTDTVYGIGAMIDDEEAVKKIYQIKKRDLDKPLACLAGSVKDIERIVEIQDTHQKVMSFWPGALTIIFRKKDTNSYLNISKSDTLAFRIPNDVCALKVLERFGVMATTSINYSGDEPLSKIDDIEKYFGNQIDYFVVNEFKGSSISSTVVDATTKDIKILRQGSIVIK